MAENKFLWANRFKSLRKRKSMSVFDFALSMDIVNPKHYKAVEEGRAAPSSHLKFLWRKAK